MKKKSRLMVAVVSVGIGIATASPPAWTQAQQAGSASIARSVGTVKTINGNVLTVAPASGPEVVATVAANARILRMVPGDKDPKNATPIQLGDVKVGDTVRVRGYANASGIDTLEVLVITSAAVDAVRDQIRQDWQKRGVGGVVDSVDAAAGNVNLSVPSLSGKKTIVVHTGKSTVVYRYSPDSAKPEEAKQVTLEGIHVGDQLRARGNRNADGNEMTAEEIYTGVFPQFPAVVKSIDASAGILSVQDLATKKTVQVKVTADSQLHKIPAEMAQGFAMRLKGGMPPGTPGAAPNAGGAGAPQAVVPSNGSSNNGSANNGAAAAGGGPGAGAGAAWRRAGGGGPPDLSRMLSRLPASTLQELELKKGDAVYILATEGTPTGAETVITLLSGVEPILQASPNASQAMMLTPWNLGGAPGGDAMQ